MDDATLFLVSDKILRDDTAQVLRWNNERDEDARRAEERERAADALSISRQVMYATVMEAVSRHMDDPAWVGLGAKAEKVVAAGTVGVHRDYAMEKAARGADPGSRPYEDSNTLPVGTNGTE